MKWHEDNRRVVGLAEFLNDQCDYFDDIPSIIHYFEEPWKWTREYGLWQLWLEEVDAERCQRVVDAVTNIESADDVRAEWEEEEPELSPDEIAEIKGDMEFHRRKDEGEL